LATLAPPAAKLPEDGECGGQALFAFLGEAKVVDTRIIR